MATYYLWSPVNTEVNEFGRVMKTAKVGEKVSSGKDLNMSDDDFKYLVEVGVLRKEPYPDIADDVAPSEHFRDFGVTSEDLTPSERKELEKFRAAEAQRQAEAQEMATTGAVTGSEGEQKSAAKGDKLSKA